jgi:hypothetical protein
MGQPEVELKPAQLERHITLTKRGHSYAPIYAVMLRGVPFFFTQAGWILR